MSGDAPSALASIRTVGARCRDAALVPGVSDLIAVVLEREGGVPPSVLAARCRHPGSAHSGRPLLMGTHGSTVVLEHTRNEMVNGADTGIRTRDFDHGVVALCQLSHVRLFSNMRNAPHPMAQASRCKFLKSCPQCDHCGAMSRGTRRVGIRPAVARLRRAGGMKKARILCRDPGLECSSSEGSAPSRCPCPDASNPSCQATRRVGGHRMAAIEESARSRSHDPHVRMRTDPGRVASDWRWCSGGSWWALGSSGVGGLALPSLQHGNGM